MNDGEPRQERLTTGIPGLDRILHGGFVREGIYIVQGNPGSGKTVLGNQLCFHHVADGGKAVFVTLLAESHARMLLNIRGFDFFDESVIPDGLNYVSALSALESEGLPGLLDLIRREVRNRRATLLVIDGLVVAEESADSVLDLKKFIHELQSHSGLLGCTTFLLGSSTPGVRPERTMVDGLIELTDPLFGSLRERRFELTKHRGTGYLRGQHAYEITDAGIVLHPRLESMLVRPSRKDIAGTRRVSTGIEGLDVMLGGEGLPIATSTMLLGPPGSGKTSTGLHFLSQCNAGEHGVYLSFFETPERAAEKAQQLGLQLKAQLESGIVRYLWKPTTENILDSVGNELIRAVDDPLVQRVFIDGLDGLRRAAVERSRLVPFVTAVVNELRCRGISTLYSEESRASLGPEIEAPPAGISAVLENWIALRFTEIGSRLRRLISVLKVRDSGFDPIVREFELTARGIIVGNPVAVGSITAAEADIDAPDAPEASEAPEAPAPRTRSSSRPPSRPKPVRRSKP
jgi:circadian clock protein KaiC